MKRYLFNPIKLDLGSKIILLSGPRQVGKTTLARSLAPDHQYLNWDNLDDRSIILGRNWKRTAPLLVLDEIHKMPKWKSWLKGIWDSDDRPKQLVVAGSARLDTAKKVGDSLAGRFFQFRLHPLDLKELEQQHAPLIAQEKFNRIIDVSGFPEPYLKGAKNYYNRWKVSHLDIILRQDLIDLESISDISRIETLISLLAARVGTQVSYDSLSRDLQCSDSTVKRWINALENLYVVFRLSPYSRNVARSLLKAQKIYFYDSARVTTGDGAKFENTVACALLKEIHRQRDCDGEDVGLFYLRDKDKHELDFLIVKDNKPRLAVECKTSDDTPDPSFKRFCPQLELTSAVQVVKDLRKEKSYAFGLDIVSGADWLKTLEL